MNGPLSRARIPQPPSPSQVTAPIVGVESAVINMITAPALQLGIPLPTLPPGPVALVTQALSRLPAPPRL